MTYTKNFGSFDRVLIDDVDVSNSFREFGLSSAHAQEPAGGFSATGIEEFLAGLTTQGFSGEAYYTEELALIIGPLHFNRTVTSILWQPRGLIDPTRENYYAECYILEFSPKSTFGSVQTFAFEAVTADANGIRVTDWT